MEINFEQERQWWNAKASSEENDLEDEAINRALRWREVNRQLEGVKTILEIGGGTGAFSIPLARRGYSVTHLDFSPAMLEIAKEAREDPDVLHEAPHTTPFGRLDEVNAARNLVLCCRLPEQE